MMSALFLAALGFQSHAAGKAIDMKGTYTLVSQTCDDGTVLPGSGGGTIKVTFDDKNMTLTDARSPGQKISTSYRMDGDKMFNLNQRTKTEVVSKIEMTAKTMTMISELPKDEWEAKKLCPKGGKKIRSLYNKS